MVHGKVAILFLKMEPFRQLTLRRFSPFLHILLCCEAKDGQKVSKFPFYSLLRPLPSMMDEYFYHLPIEVGLLLLSLLVHCCHVIFLTNRLQRCEASDLRQMSMWKFHQNLFCHNIIWLIKPDNPLLSLCGCHSLHVRRLHVVNDRI